MHTPPVSDNGTLAHKDLFTLSIDRSGMAQIHGSSKGWVTPLLIFLTVSGAALAAWWWHQTAPLAVETVAVANAVPSQALTMLNATGYVVAQRKASVASKATGRLEWLGVLEGSRVRAGDLIAILESRDTEAMRDQAAANVQVAEANLVQGQAELSEAELGFKRSADLVTNKFISESSHDSAVSRLNKARAAMAGHQAAVAVAVANLRVSEVALDQTRIRAPFDGVVIARNANVGDTITPFSQTIDSKGAVVTIADMTSLEVEADVAESSLSGIRVGQPVEIQLDAIPGQRFEGMLNRIVPTMDRAKASILVKIRFSQPDSRVLPDMSAKVAFLKREMSEGLRKSFLAIPLSAAVDVNGRKHVYVVQDGKARLRTADFGSTYGDLIEVRGIEVGTRVVIRPPEGLADGRAVKLGAK